MIPKPRKNPMDISSYRPISLLPTISKVLVKLIPKIINKDLNPQDWIPNHQSGFQQAHSTMQQCHRTTDGINRAMENQQYCTAACLDISQAFDKVWHPALLLKIKKILPSSYSNLLKSYLSEHQIEQNVSGETSSTPLYPKGMCTATTFHNQYLTVPVSVIQMDTNCKPPQSTITATTTACKQWEIKTMLAFRLARHLRWHRWTKSLTRRGNTWYCSVLCIIITLAYRLYSFWLVINKYMLKNMYGSRIYYC